MTPQRQATRAKWAIRVTSRDGFDMYLRHGAIPGEGHIVLFGSRKLAEMNAETFIQPGLDDGATLAIVRLSAEDITRED